MLLPPADLDHAALERVVARAYGASARPLEFHPCGEDSWCYRAGPVWVSVRRDLRGHVAEAYAAAHELHAAGLDFVLAPVPGDDGELVRRVGRYPVVVFPYVEATPLVEASVRRADAARIVEMIGALHGAAVATGLPAETFELSFDRDLDLAIAIADGAPAGDGPYAERLRRLLATHRARLAELRAEFARLARAAARERDSFVLTHGEPIVSNVLRSGERLLLADWGELAWGPPERDWSHVRRTAGAAPACRLDLRRLYDVRWILSEVAEYVAVLAEPHAGSPDDAAMWERLVRYLPERPLAPVP